MWRTTKIAWGDFVNFILTQEVLDILAVFSRCGACLMILPGFSHERIPVRARLYIAFWITLPLVALLQERLNARLANAQIIDVAGMVLSEVLIGALLGFLSRIFILALETGASAIVTSIGIGNLLGGAVAENESLPAMANLVVLGALALIFMVDQHWQLIRGLYDSYQYVPLFTIVDGSFALDQLVESLRQSYQLVLRISTPFLMFGLLVNLSFGFLNRMTPQVPVYFLSAPFLIYFGLHFTHSVSSDLFNSFLSGFGQFITGG